MSALDDAVCTTSKQIAGPDDAVVAWVTLAGMRSLDGGGYVVTVISDDGPPAWQVRGMLMEALAAIDNQCACDDHD